MEESKVSEFKTIGGQRTLVSKKQMGHSGSLPSLSRQGMGASSPGFFSQNHAFRQRGILSEVVKPHRRQEVDSCKMGPSDLGTCSSTLRKSASATSFALSERLRAKAQKAEPQTPRKIVQDVEPKVIEVYSHKPGDRPRKVTVERRRKWFEALDVVALLEERNFNFSPNWDRDFWLQLDDFNNVEFDIRTPEQWLELTKQPDGSFLPLQAKAMRFHETKGSVWEDCTVEGLKDLEDGKGTKDFLVRWPSSGAEAELEPVGRLRIVVQGEDPEVYADRILFAFEALQKAQARIRLNFFALDHPGPSDHVGAQVDLCVARQTHFWLLMHVNAFKVVSRKFLRSITEPRQSCGQVDQCRCCSFPGTEVLETVRNVAIAVALGMLLVIHDISFHTRMGTTS